LCVARGRAGLTLVELLVLIVVLGVVVALVHSCVRRTPRYSNYIRDNTQVRGVHQAMMLFANNHMDRYPLPSEIDRANTTLTQDSAKDDLGGVLSVLIYDGFISPELTVSRRETSPFIQVHETYALSRPPHAVDSHAESQARWDPAFRGSPAEQVAAHGHKAAGTLAESANAPAHNSYAMMPFFAARRERWTSTFASTEAIIGNRGPSYEVVGSGADARYRLLKTGTVAAGGGFTLHVGKGTSSNTLGIHAKRDTWEGNVAYNDNSVVFETRGDPQRNFWTFSGLAPEVQHLPDNLFVAEDDATVTPLPVQIGTLDVTDERRSNPLTMMNNWLKTWTVERVTRVGETSAITVVVD
jgi:Tfp pilus assembly protein PilE